MPTPVLHLVAGPNSAGKTTFYERILGPATGLPFINAEVARSSRGELQGSAEWPPWTPKELVSQ